MPKFTTQPSMTVCLPHSFGGVIQRAKERGKTIEVTIEETQDPRTQKQNALLHVLIRRLAQASGASEEWMKEYIKHEGMVHNYPVWVDNGEIVTDERGEALPKPTSQATVKELMILIEACYAVAYENGLDISRD